MSHRAGAPFLGDATKAKGARRRLGGAALIVMNVKSAVTQ